MEVKQYTHCLRCGRKLKNPAYRQIGYGAVCLKKTKTTNKPKLFNLHNKINSI